MMFDYDLTMKLQYLLIMLVPSSGVVFIVLTKRVHWLTAVVFTAFTSGNFEALGWEVVKYCMLMFCMSAQGYCFYLFFSVPRMAIKCTKHKIITTFARGTRPYCHLATSFSKLKPLEQQDIVYLAKIRPYGFLFKGSIIKGCLLALSNTCFKSSTQTLAQNTSIVMSC